MNRSDALKTLVGLWGGMLFDKLDSRVAVGPSNLHGVVDVRDYGAAGDGSADDTAGLQRAIDAVQAGGGAVWFPPGTYLISSQVVVPSPNTCLLGGTGATIRIKKDSVMAEGPSGAPCAIFVTADNCRVSGLRLDGDLAHNTQDVAGILVSGGHFVADRLEILNVCGSSKYGSGLRLQQVLGAHLSDLVSHHNGSDGIDLFGACSEVEAVNLKTYRNGIVGVDIEASGPERPGRINICNVISRDNAAANVLILGAEDVVVQGLVACSAAIAPSGNNGSVKVRGSKRVAISAFTIRGPGAGVHPIGLWLDDEGTAEQNTDIVIGPGLISGMQSDGLALDRTGSRGGSSNVTLLGVRSSGNGGYGVNIREPAMVDHMTLVGCDFSRNVGGAQNNLARVRSRTVTGCTPVDLLR